MPEQFDFYVGIDWATQNHEVCVLDSQRRVIDRKAIQHSGTGLAQMTQWLLGLCGNQPSRVAVAMEMPHGAVVETLIEQQFVVFSLNPKQMDRFRDRHTVAGAKDDRRDAFVLADSLRTDRYLFWLVDLDEPQVILIRELSRAEEEITQEQVRTGHQLRELLRRYYPQMLNLCPGVDEPWFWDLVEIAPSPEAARKLSSRRVQRLLDLHRIRRLEAAEIITALKEPSLHLAPGSVEAISERILFPVARLRLLREQRKQLESRIQAVLAEMDQPGQNGEHRDVTIILSLPGVGRVVAATMLAEASQALAQRDYHALRSYAGAAPITRQSGKKRIVLMRKSCNLRMRNALYHWSRVSVQHDEVSKEHYARLRAAGHSHGRALRGVVDRLLTVLVAMLKSGTLYDPTLRSKRATSEPAGQAA